QLSGVVPQICVLLGPSAAGGAYIPAFCDVVIMVENEASMYLGSPRMAEMVIGERVSLEEMGGARMHCAVSGCGDLLVSTEDEAIDLARRYLSYVPQHYAERPAATASAAPEANLTPVESLIPIDENKPFDMWRVIEHVVDKGTWFELKP